jgi:amino acid transporter
MAAFDGETPGVKVPVGEVAVAAYQAVFGRLGLVLELGWVPVLALLAARLAPDLIMDHVFSRPSVVGAKDGLDVVSLGQAALSLLCLNAFAVRWHHVMLFANARAVPRRLFLAGWLRFLAYAVVIYLIAIGYWAGVFFASRVLLAGGANAATEALATVVVALGIAVSLLLMRSSLLFPAAASGRPLHWLDAWRLMRGNTWRAAATTFLVLMPIVIAVGLLLKHLLAAVHLDSAEGLPAQPPLGLFLLSGVVEVVLDFLFVALVASILSEFYRRIVLRRVSGTLPR